MSITRWEPFSELMSLRDAMDRLFEESFVRPGRLLGLPAAGTVPVDMYQQDNNLIVKAAIPGVRPEDIDVSVVGSTLTIKGETKEEKEVKEENVIRRERRFGAFSRSVTLPSPVDPNKASASYEHGILTLTLPVAEEARPKEIKVQAR
ncbi:MAG: Hsp20/alpha crystallin family protein [Anaerolineae bacterium]|nr:Hsp20/alpha crystallin family protein [Anaerolineae bacterium]